MSYFKKVYVTDESGQNTADVKTNPSTSSNELLVNLEGHLCTENTTETPLGIDGVFTGTGFQDTLDYGVISIDVHTDQNSATDGLEVQWSYDGITVSNTDKFTVLANVPKTFTFGPANRYIRLKYTNGGVAQTDFSLQTLLRKVYVKPSSHRISDSIVGQDDAELVKAVLTGLAPNGEFKNVLVTNSGNQKVSLEEFESGVSSNSNTQLNVTQYDSTGTEGIIQAVKEDANNSSTTNLASANSYTFTGTGTSTLGVVGLQWNLKTDQNATVYIEQSDDNVNWDVSDSFNYYHAKGAIGNTVQAITSYWRIRVVLTGTTDTTYFRLKGILCPIAVPLPRSLNTYGRLATSSCIQDCETGKQAEVEGLGALKTVTPIRLVGTTFSGTTKDTNFWTETVTGSGSVTQAGEITLSTGTTADSTSLYRTVDKARKITGASNQFRAVARNVETPATDCIRRIGAYDDDEGFFLQFDGITFGVASRKGSVDTVIENGSLNGNLGATIDFGGGTDFTRIIIEYTSLSAKFFLNGILIHTISASTTSLTNSLNLPVTMEIINENGNTTNNSYEILFATILRLGEFLTGSNSYFQQGTTAGVVLKYNAGTIKSLVISAVSNNAVLTLYDNTAASGTVLWSSGTLGAQTQPFDVQFSGLPFDTGLTLVVSGASASVLVVYE